MRHLALGLPFVPSECRASPKEEYATTEVFYDAEDNCLRDHCRGPEWVHRVFVCTHSHCGSYRSLLLHELNDVAAMCAASAPRVRHAPAKSFLISRSEQTVSYTLD